MSFPSEELVFVPLGGTGEIGMNLYLYGYGKPGEEEWLMVDCGITFGDDTTPGVDVILPDPKFIAERADDLHGIIITHAHEDHLGAIPHLWEKFQCPIYATPFTASIMRRKLEDAKLANIVPLHELPLGGDIKLGPFDIELVNVTHSIPEPNALSIKTPAGTVLHSGDWKLDPAPVIGETADEKRFAEIGKEGVLALICDSTNVFNPGRAGSEGDLLKSLTELFSQYDEGRIAVACFASNVARLETITKAAIANDRNVALVGRSLWRFDKAARENGYLQELPEFLSDEDVPYIPSEKLLIICTGSQGEPRAALARIANGDHPHVTLGEGDVVIYSSRVIPGNEKSIGRMQNALMRRGVEIVTADDHFVHVSGHPGREEIKRLYKLVKPQIVVPIHGEVRHLNENADLAEDCGVEEVIVPEDGDIIRLGPQEPDIVGSAPIGRLCIEGNRIIRLDGEVQRSRKRVIFNGSAVISVVIDTNGRLLAEPQVTTQGLLSEDDDHIEEGAINAALSVFKGLKRKEARDDDALREKIRVATRRYFKGAIGKRPITDIHLVRV